MICRSQKKAILLSSNSNRIIYILKDRKNELKTKIISLIWLHPRFMTAAFKGNYDQAQNSYPYYFLSSLSIFYKCYRQSQPLETLKLDILFPSGILKTSGRSSVFSSFPDIIPLCFLIFFVVLKFYIYIIFLSVYQTGLWSLGFPVFHIGKHYGFV